MGKLTFVFSILLIGGCASGFHEFYTPVRDVDSLPNPEILQNDQEPELLYSDDIWRDVRELNAKRYVVLGYSSFNGGLEDAENARIQARKVGATVVLVNSEFTHVETNTTVAVLPDNSTTYHQGGGTANSTYFNRFGQEFGSSSSSMSFNGTSTTNGTTAVPVTTTQRRFDQEAAYLVKIDPPTEWRFGVLFQDLTPEMKLQYERNNGACVDLILEDTPVFDANVLCGDILVSIDGVEIRNAEHAQSLVESVPADAERSVWVIMRKGQMQEREIEIDLSIFRVRLSGRETTQE